MFVQLYLCLTYDISPLIPLPSITCISTSEKNSNFTAVLFSVSLHEIHEVFI